VSGRWLLIAPLTCAFVLGAAAFLAIEEPNTSARIAVLVAMAAMAILMLLAFRGGPGRGE
jgi:hypothetical protein